MVPLNHGHVTGLTLGGTVIGDPVKVMSSEVVSVDR